MAWAGKLESLSAAEPGPSSAARAQPTITNQIPADRRYWVLGTVMLVQFTAVMTSTIVSTATPTIVDELHGLNLYAWLFSSYLLASSVTVPVVGKLSDLFGRRPFYIGGLLLFLLGSAFSGLSQNMGELIAARAVTGIGGGAMMALGVTTIGDIFSPRERGRWMGLIMGVFGLGSIVGPLVGGFTTDHFGWRWVFLVNLPLGLIALAMIAVLMPRLAGHGRVRIDWLGLVLAPMMIGFVIGSLIGGQLTTRTGRYKVQTVIGMVVAVVGMFLLSRLPSTSTFTQLLVGMVITGIGVGAVFPTLSVVVQSAFPYRMLGTANAARQFFNNLGAVMGVPVMATIVIETLKNELPRHLPAGSGSQLAKAATSGAQGLIAGQRQGLTEAFGK